MTRKDKAGLGDFAPAAAPNRHGLSRRWQSTLASVLLVGTAWTGLAHAQTDEPQRPRAAAAPTVSPSVNASGAERRVLAEQLGRWTVTETVWSAPGVEPVVTGNLVAERRLAGTLLEETLRSASDPTILRRDFLTFNRVEGRWEYMSFDTRAPVGMMTAQSYGPEKDGKIELIFQPFAMPGGNASIDGQMLRMRQDIIRLGPDSVRKDQYFTLADGVGGEWLAHRYDAVRSR